MGCTVDFSAVSDIAYSCDELSTGGLKTVYLCDKSDLEANGTLSVTDGEVTILGYWLELLMALNLSLLDSTTRMASLTSLTLRL
jgi:hypothetical protein